MNIVKLATKSAWKYSKKTFFIKLLTFLSLFTVLISVNVLVNSFNDWVYRSQVYSLPSYIITTLDDYAITDYTPLHTLNLTTANIDSLRANKDFTFYEYISFGGQIINAENPDDTGTVIFIGLDFAHLGDIFPYFDGFLSDGEVDSYKASPSVLVNASFQMRFKTSEGADYIYFGRNYYREPSVLRFTIEEIDESPLIRNDLMNTPTVFIDIQHLKTLALAPEDSVFSSVAVPNKIIPPYSIKNYFATKKLMDLAAEQNLFVTTVTEFSEHLESTFVLYKNAIFAVSVIILLILAYTVSTNLYIHFQTRRIDFGLYKTFGCTDSNLFLFIFIENICNMGLTVLAVLLCNLLISALVPQFFMLETVYFIPHVTLMGFLVIAFSAIFIALISVISSYKFISGQKPYMIFTKRAI